MDNFLASTAAAFSQLKAHLPITIGFLTLLYGIHILNWLVKYRLNLLGIWPRKLFGLIGIPFSPFLHGDFGHLIFNSLPLFVFSNFILLQGPKVFFAATTSIILLSGLLTWIFGRRGIHVGASGLIMGYLGYIIVDIYFNPTILSVIIGLVCLYYFGGIFANLLPSGKKQVSWEGHVLGFISGLVIAFIFAHQGLIAFFHL